MFHWHVAIGEDATVGEFFLYCFVASTWWRVEDYSIDVGYLRKWGLRSVTTYTLPPPQPVHTAPAVGSRIGRPRSPAADPRVASRGQPSHFPPPPKTRRNAIRHPSAYFFTSHFSPPPSRSHTRTGRERKEAAAALSLPSSSPPIGDRGGGTIGAVAEGADSARAALSPIINLKL
ncbi:hypothetical protein E2562_015485 [Oryza meyeriana var. granulata]|uniref:Uncharacterized protein n=1 Tax=Oryza meyeriana var. granulata TaxID=110450 RepID=A0A6G1BYH3_9ORYZ|nr:hypothetical protein E2562_015485 [Oryza meyeriana var. granulata]